MVLDHKPWIMESCYSSAVEVTRRTVYLTSEAELLFPMPTAYGGPGGP